LADASTLDRGRNKAFKERWEETQEPEENTMLQVYLIWPPCQDHGEGQVTRRGFEKNRNKNLFQKDLVGWGKIDISRNRKVINS